MVVRGFRWVALFGDVQGLFVGDRLALGVGLSRIRAELANMLGPLGCEMTGGIQFEAGGLCVAFAAAAAGVSRIVWSGWGGGRVRGDWWWGRRRLYGVGWSAFLGVFVLVSG